MRKIASRAGIFTTLVHLVLALASIAGAQTKSAAKPSPGASGSATAAAGSSMWVTGYYPVWSYCSMSPSDLDWTTLTHVIMFSADPDPTTYPYFSPVTKASDSSSIEWGVPNPNCSPQGKWGKPAGYSYIRWLTDSAHAHGAKVILCLGGIYGTGRDNMAIIGADSAMTQAWAEAAVAYIKRKGMDGLDLDWEYPSGSSSGYMRMLRILRRQLDTMTPPGVLAIAAPAWTNNSAYDFATIGTIVDQINIMSYDFSGGSSAWFNAGIGNNTTAYPTVGSTDGTSSWWNWNNHGAKQWIQKGVPANRLAMGIPFYSWRFAGPTGVTQPITGGRWYGTYGEALDKINQYGMGIYHWDDSAKAPYLTYSENGTNYYITYDDTNSVKYKAEWCRDNNLGGVMLYELVAGWVNSAQAGRKDPLLKGVKSIIGGSSILPTPPNPPVPTSPSEGALNVPTSTSLAWNGAAGASSYRVQVSATSAFTALTLDRAGVVSNSALVTGLLEGTRYYWRVSATNTAGTSAWSAARSFTTVPPPAPVPDITGRLFFDANQNHVQDQDEPAMAGWVVSLSGPASGTDVTDSSGNYAFYDLLPGSYTVTAETRPLWTMTAPALSPSIAVAVVNGAAPVEASFGAYAPAAFSFPVDRQWNVVSLPVQTPDRRKVAIFPLAITATYSFHDGYEVADTLEPGPAYWVKFGAGHTVWTAGSTVSAETVAVSAGWNFLGSLSTAVPVENVTSDPPGIIAGNIFGYKRGNYIADSIHPGRGYWVLASADGRVFVSSSPPGNAASRRPAEPLFNALHALTFSSVDGSSQSLYFGAAGLGADVAMPPVPPAGVFDARFVNDATGGAIARVVDAAAGASAELPIALRSATYPMEISWDMKTSEQAFYLRVNRSETIALTGKGSFTLERAPDAGAAPMAVIVQGRGTAALPSAFALRQNYPNPFNNTTMIAFTLPFASRVRLDVYNVLGERMGTVVDGEMGPGSYALPYDASRLASGVYFYTLAAYSAATGEHFTKTNSMVLSK